MLNIILGLIILILMFTTPLVTLAIMGELFALTKTHKNVDILSKICAIIVVVEIIFEVLLLLYLIGSGAKM